VHGDYEHKEAAAPDCFINFGYSKDGRPDLKRFLYGLSVSVGKVPVQLMLTSGNLDDKSWSFDYIKKLAKTLTPEMLSEVIIKKVTRVLHE